MLESLGLPLLKYLLPLLATLLTFLGSYAAKKLLDKLGVNRSEQIDAMIDKYVGIGVKYAQSAADNKLLGYDMTGKDKLQLAVGTVLRELEQSGITKVGEELIKSRIEAYLHDNKVALKGNTGANA